MTKAVSDTGTTAEEMIVQHKAIKEQREKECEKSKIEGFEKILASIGGYVESMGQTKKALWIIGIVLNKFQIFLDPLQESKDSIIPVSLFKDIASNYDSIFFFLTEYFFLTSSIFTLTS